MARRITRQFCQVGVHSPVYGRPASSGNSRKLIASTRVGAEAA